MPSWTEILNLAPTKDLVQTYFTAKQSTTFDPTTVQLDPLSPTENNPWDTNFKDTQLKEIITRDTTRIFPELELFKSKSVGQVLENVLFVWCKVEGFRDRGDCNYRQGMHELAAIVLISVLNHDRNETITDTCNSTILQLGIEIEALVFAIFKTVMQNIGYLYARHDSDQQPITTASLRVYQELEIIDYLLYKHLISLKIEPQVFCIRWLRLLFCREFEMDQVVSVWESIIADFDLVIWIAVSMLLQIKPQLLQTDYTLVMQTLMRYPKMSNESVKVIVERAMALKNDKKLCLRLKNACEDIAEVEKEVDPNARMKLRAIRTGLMNLMVDIKQLEEKTPV